MVRRWMITLMSLTMIAANANAQQASPDEFNVVLDAYLTRYKPLWLEAAAAWWEANTTGSDAAFERKKAADSALVELHSDRELFAKIKSIKERGAVTEPVAARQLDIIYRAYLKGQADPELQRRIVGIENDVTKAFNNHRSQVGDRTLTENDVREVLAKSADSRDVETAWKAYMQVGVKADPMLRELVKLRNETARQLGFKNFYVMQLALQEIDEAVFLKLFDELDELTREPFAKSKTEMDAAMARRFNVAPPDLRPWHFGDLFFQDPPGAGAVDLDALFQDADLVDLAQLYYSSMGLPCEDIVQRSDLYEKPGKSPHAFSTDLDREGDIRTLCNMKPNLYWADTLLHELAHAVYDKNIRRDQPFLLREASHSITTEGIAMMFGAMCKDEDWLVNVLKLDPGKAADTVRAAKAALRAEKVLFARWSLVMVRFEHGMYSNPDQNLGKLWWDLKKRYQLLNPPESVDRPDYAAKVHILTAPVYYHSYLMGDLFAAQVRNHVLTKVLPPESASRTSFYREPKAGEYLREQVFGPGNLYSWNELTRRATGEPLTARYFAQLFVH